MKLSAVLLSLLCGVSAWAGRVLEVVPIRNDSVHGSRVSGAIVGCVTADVTTDIPAEGPGSANPGVRLARHAIQIDLKNVSQIPQTVRIEIDPGSALSSTHSSPPDAATPNLNGINANLAGLSQPAPVVIPAGGSETYLLHAYAGTLPDQWVVVDWSSGPTARVVAGNNSLLPASGGCNGSLTPVNCIMLQTLLRFRILVQEDRGAMIGNLFSAVHRCGGLRDHPLSPPQSLLLNGGRPF